MAEDVRNLRFLVPILWCCARFHHTNATHLILSAKSEMLDSYRDTYRVCLGFFRVMIRARIAASIYGHQFVEMWDVQMRVVDRCHSRITSVNIVVGEMIALPVALIACTNWFKYNSNICHTHKKHIFDRRTLTTFEKGVYDVFPMIFFARRLAG